MPKMPKVPKMPKINVFCLYKKSQGTLNSAFLGEARREDGNPACPP